MRDVTAQHAAGIDSSRDSCRSPSHRRARAGAGTNCAQRSTQAQSGRGLLLCVAGEPGIGKTTLVEDFLAELATGHQCTIARGRCSERLAGTEAYLPLLEALEQLAARAGAIRAHRRTR